MPRIPAPPEPLVDERVIVRLSAERDIPEILIAYQMNGEPLTPDHGAPFRLIVPH